ncbi:MAG: tetratricopeptide repeat protein [bacterium]
MADFPENINLRFGLGYFYQRHEKYPEAFEVFEQMVQDSSNNLSALYQIGRTGALSGKNLVRAEECMKMYLQQEPGKNMPSLAAAHWRLGMIYEHKKQKELARQEYQTALKLDPEFKAAKKALKKLK